MPKLPLSVTLDQDNLLWLRSQTTAAKRSLSETLDQLVTEARLAGRVPEGSVRSVVGTVDITGDDPLLSGADDYVRGLFDASVRRPILVRETPPRYRKPSRGRRRG
jgi:hypothetical protein